MLMNNVPLMFQDPTATKKLLPSTQLHFNGNSKVEDSELTLSPLIAHLTLVKLLLIQLLLTQLKLSYSSQ